jgi:hypothetical protein
MYVTVTHPAVAVAGPSIDVDHMNKGAGYMPDQVSAWIIQVTARSTNHTGVDEHRPEPGQQIILRPAETKETWRCLGSVCHTYDL